MTTEAERAVMHSSRDFYEIQGKRVFPVVAVEDGHITTDIAAYLWKSVPGQEDTSHGLLGRKGNIAHVKDAITVAVDLSASDTYEQAESKIEAAYKILEAA